MEIADRDYYIYAPKRTREEVMNRLKLISSPKYSNSIFNPIDRLYQDFVEYIAGQKKSQFTNENENILLAKDILKETTNLKFKNISKGFKVVNKFDFEDEPTTGGMSG